MQGFLVTFKVLGSALIGPVFIAGSAIPFMTGPADAGSPQPFESGIQSSLSDGTCSAEETSSSQPYYTCPVSMISASFAAVVNARENPAWGIVDLFATLDGTTTINSGNYGFAFSTFGVTGYSGLAADPSGNAPPAYANGGAVAITNSGSLTISHMVASDLYFQPAPGQSDSYPGNVAWGAGAIVGFSLGAEGFATKSQDQDPNFDGGAGGGVAIVNTEGASISITPIGSTTTYGSTSIPVAANAIGAFSIGGTGWGARTSVTDHAGNGGDGGAITVVNNGSIFGYTDSAVVATNGVFAVSKGGIANIAEQDAPDPGTGGTGGTVTVENSGIISIQGQASAAASVGIAAMSVGGNANDFTRVGGESNDKSSYAGDGGAVLVTLIEGSAITAVAGDSAAIGVLAVSAGGYSDNNRQGAGGSATVTIDEGASVTTAGGPLSIGVLAASAGTLADIAPAATSEVSTAYPGSPGAVTITNGGTVSSTGQMAIGLAAVSAGGTSVVTNGDTSVPSNVLGNVAESYGGFSGSTATLSNTGSVQTLGASAHGLVALSAGGGGGLINLIDGTQNTSLGSKTSNSTGGNGATVSVTNSGTVTTGNGAGAGEASIGIVAQSIGGGGGSTSGRPVLLGGLDADGSGGGDGGTVAVSASGASAIETLDWISIGILAQSVGGGGGNGANSWGVIAAVGGGGGNGGDGQDVGVSLEGSSGAVTTKGQYAAGVVAQSIGGGGGNGGYADSFGSVFSAAIGGTGGSGGSGGDVAVSTGHRIATAGDLSWGIAAQSVGGGGGSGGAAASDSLGIITVAMALGGFGGAGGDGGLVTIANTGQILTGAAGSGTYSFTGEGAGTLGADSHGILAQSIGGGGGAGGSATARSLGLPSSDIPTVTFDFALGGSGGSGGDGGKVSVSNTNTVKTAGDGAHGVVAQSTGGGGGAGGDSTAASYALAGGVADINLDLSLGGAGGASGWGGTVTVFNGTPPSGSAGGGWVPCQTDCAGTIETYGNGAYGILATSVGGGGGAGGTGNASSSSASLGNLLTDSGAATSFQATAAVGGTGGSGNIGGDVVAANVSGSSIRTYGASSYGIYAQSVGGGGGAAGGSSAGVGAGKIKLSASVGGNGGIGNDGGSVLATNDGTITTGGYYTTPDGTVVAIGGDSIGIFAQSIGGGGGAGGSADPASTFDFKGQAIKSIEALFNGGLNPSLSKSISYSGSVDVGGKGAPGGAGGEVGVVNTGQIQTYGHRSYGIEAQSIGGGGGNGGTATANSSSTWSAINKDLEAVGDNLLAGSTGQFSFSLGANVSIGGTGGSGSTGGTLEVGNTGSIITAGYGAHGVLAQSIGGGGGVGAEGTPGVSATLGIGFGFSGSGGSGNSGGTVTIKDAGDITTVGDDAYGILAQSIGGGGGLAGAGCTNSSPQYASLGVKASQCLSNSLGTSESFSALTKTLDIGIEFKGSAGTYSGGDSVWIEKQNGSIITGGARAMGIVAQSIGGGGGLAVGANDNISNVSFESISETGDGSPVFITLGEGASVTTYGDGAWGIFAQSIGAGGGFFGDPSLTLGFANVNSLALVDGSDVVGGNMNVSLAGDITTQGTNAHGVVLQTSASGNSGGVGMNGLTILGGSLGSSQTMYGDGGSIGLTQTGGTISTTGEGSNGIFAQSVGSTTSTSTIGISIGGTVKGGIGGTGILVSGGAAPNTGAVNTVTIISGGTVSTASGVMGDAVTAYNSTTNLTNNGTLTGNVGLWNNYGTFVIDASKGNQNTSSSGTFVNNGTYVSGPQVVASGFENSGVLSIGGDRNIAETLIYADDVEQTSSGKWIVDIDALNSNMTSDLLVAQGGSITLAGELELIVRNLTATDAYQIALAQYGPSYQVYYDSLVLPETLLFSWHAYGGNYLDISPVADFTPSGVTLTKNETKFASYLQRTWDAGGSAAMNKLYTLLYDIGAARNYTDVLDDLAGETLSVHANDQMLAARTGLDRTFSCPVFAGEGTLLVETSCVWGRVEGTSVEHGNATGAPSYQEDLLIYRVGGQKELAAGWFLGASAAYTSTDAKAAAFGASSEGKRASAALAAKRVLGPWYFGFGGSLGYGWYDNRRSMDTYGRSQLISSDSNVLTAGARARVQYALPYANWYLRPRMDFDLIYTHVPSYREAGPSPAALDFREQNEATFAFAPYLEVGGRIDFGDGWWARPYAGAGCVVMSNDAWVAEASLIGAPAAAGTFAIESEVPKLLGQFDFGLQLARFDAIEARLEYSLAVGESYQANTGTARVSVKF